MELQLLHAEWIGVSFVNLMRHYGALHFCQTAAGNTDKFTIWALYTRTRMHTYVCFT